MKERLIILLAEDDPQDIALLGLSLPRTGVPVELQVTRDGQETLEYLQGEGRFSNRQMHPVPDLLMLDLKMPRVDGLEVVRWVRSTDEWSSIPIVMLSSSTLDRDIQEAYRLGANTFFSKPNGLPQLRELIRLVVSYWASSQRPGFASCWS
jgi:CheY-like chemotaxis protein